MEALARSVRLAHTKLPQELLSVMPARQIPTHQCRAHPRLPASVIPVTMGLMAATAQRAPWADTKQIRGIRLPAVTTASRASTSILLAMMKSRTVWHVRSILATTLQQAQLNPTARATSGTMGQTQGHAQSVLRGDIKM